MITAIRGLGLAFALLTTIAVVSIPGGNPALMTVTLFGGLLICRGVFATHVQDIVLARLDALLLVSAVASTIIIAQRIFQLANF